MSTSTSTTTTTTTTTMAISANDNVKGLVLPAHETKHIPLLIYPLSRENVIFHLCQSDDGANNGTALWLGAQILSAYLTDALPCPRMNLVVYAISPIFSDILFIKVYTSHAYIQLEPNANENEHVLTGPRPSAEFGLSTSSILIHSSSSRKSRAIELGSGVGLTALVLAAQGWSVLATDTQAVVNSVLRPNIHRNTRMTRLPGSIQVRPLDWTVPPENWNWNNPESVTPSSLDESESLRDDATLLGPPFDLILTADTIYSPDLITPLLRTLKHLIILSSPSSTPSSNSRIKQNRSHPSIYVALEKRDPAQLASFFSQAHEIWGLSAHRVPTPRVRRALSRTGLSHWKKEDWEGVEVWRIYLLDSELHQVPT